METLYVKINIRPSDEETDEIREAGLFFSNIADALGLERNNITEIDETNYLSEIRKIEHKFKND